MIEQADLELIDSAVTGPLDFLCRVTEPAEIGAIDPGRLAKLYIMCALISKRAERALEPEIERAKERRAASITLAEMNEAPLAATEFPEYWEEHKEAMGRVGVLGIASLVNESGELTRSTIFVDELHPIARVLDYEGARNGLRILISKSWGRILAGDAVEVKFVSRE